LKKKVTPRFGGGFFRTALQIVAIFSILLTWQSCAEPDGIGLGLIDDKPGFLTTDTISLLAFTERDDTIPTNLGFQNLLGLMHDPVFGKVRASIITQFRLPTNDFSLGTEPLLDSIVLSLGYTGRYYGNLETLQTIRVYELADDVPAADTLYNNQPLNVFSRPIGEKILRPAPNDSTLIDTTFFAPHFSIRLANKFGQKIINANGTQYFENIVNFLEYFKGFKITVEDDFSEGGSIFNINMYSFFTRLSVHYREAEDTLQRPRVYHFYINEFTKRMTFVEHFEFEGGHSMITEQLLNPEQPADSLVFLRSLGGLRAKIKMPHVGELENISNITINQAQLIIPVDSAFIEEDYFAARRLFLVQESDEGDLISLRDYQTSQAYFGGIYNESLAQYEFNITQHIQEVLSGALENNDLILLISGGAENAERIVLKGPGRSENPMRLKIRYTVFN
jgi:hypothetical protein